MFTFSRCSQASNALCMLPPGIISILGSIISLIYVHPINTLVNPVSLSNLRLLMSTSCSLEQLLNMPSSFFMLLYLKPVKSICLTLLLLKALLRSVMFVASKSLKVILST